MGFRRRFAGLKIYGESSRYDPFKQPNGSTSEPTWSRLVDDSTKKGLRGWPRSRRSNLRNTIRAHASDPARKQSTSVKKLPIFEIWGGWGGGRGGYGGGVARVIP